MLTAGVASSLVYVSVTVAHNGTPPAPRGGDGVLFYRTAGASAWLVVMDGGWWLMGGYTTVGKEGDGWLAGWDGFEGYPLGRFCFSNLIVHAFSSIRW